MSLEIGFDLYPCLQKNELPLWDEFLSAVKTHYAQDPVVQVTDLGLLFKVGKNPILLSEGIYFRRFSSDLFPESNAGPYIRQVIDIAKNIFGKKSKSERIIPWNTYTFDTPKHYKGKEVREMYEQARKALRCIQDSSLDTDTAKDKKEEKEGELIDWDDLQQEPV